MTIKQLLNTYSDDTILEELLRVYPDQKVNLKGYNKALKQLRKTEPLPSSTVINLSTVKDEDEEHTSISIIEKGSSERLSASFIPWNEFIGMKITKDGKNTLSKLTPKLTPKLEILVHCLWEMTWYGYTNEEVQEELMKLETIVERVER